jgi:hypothetical protein
MITIEIQAKSNQGDTNQSPCLSVQPYASTKLLCMLSVNNKKWLGHTLLLAQPSRFPLQASGWPTIGFKPFTQRQHTQYTHNYQLGTSFWETSIIVA